MKVLVLGGCGSLGHKLVQGFKSRFESCATFHGSFEKYRGIEILTVFGHRRHRLAVDAIIDTAGGKC